MQHAVPPTLPGSNTTHDCRRTTELLLRRLLEAGQVLSFAAAVRPPTEFLAMVNDGLIDHYAADSPTGRLLGAPVKTVPALVSSANPAAFVSAQSAPALLLHGAADPVVPLEQSELLFAALRQHGVKSRLQVYPGYTHGEFRFNTGARLATIEAFLDELCST